MIERCAILAILSIRQLLFLVPLDHLLLTTNNNELTYRNSGGGRIEDEYRRHHSLHRNAMQFLIDDRTSQAFSR